MSNTDSFIEEVTEEVRRDRLFALLRRWGWVAVLLVLLIVGGAGWNEWRKAQAEAGAQALGDALYSALDENEAEARAQALSAIDTTGSAGAVAALLLAAEQEAAGDVPAAIATLEGVVTDGEVPQDYRDLAALKSLMLSAGTMDEATRRAALENLALPGQTFRLVAMEQVALSHVRAGETEAALDQLAAILEDAETGDALRDRAQSLTIALGGEIDAQDGAGN
ncbi:tetratricopeptide repeat protein [Ponticoccus sp. SC2-23]|uniref:tetratricopeptide repeat protein n=1 Tax=Alexandriicola marinus TaxID=2081710 RepID=UPI000FD9FC76|nr:tetratricopeptide repeat protein [Alexandriicola marinus]MBM1222388.1 tetratricopeptide repeat protein [Ponticoccus sp. SC6-9]MBM1224501.1 tetratricopeptide repeat protein [Ponticoccus sp. SC6-15]MBM1229719.1 tetratricopeptide repeat protein [Ponticoccus sp. SC6-38]MBM1233467.1 tetratricopeptide repeat protein [Ponticoccus sp. SC6-45]MBM1236583.1 tetratricopeptide repeat protein [Ponticoccus sp. SC6-49]MBM1244627.1 tetratricopeptide repeat protein [Ponticoccus sp. SC2-64]MBM1246991.1 tetr